MNSHDGATTDNNPNNNYVDPDNNSEVSERLMGDNITTKIATVLLTAAELISNELANANLSGEMMTVANIICTALVLKHKVKKGQ